MAVELSIPKLYEPEVVTPIGQSGFSWELKIFGAYLSEWTAFLSWDN